MLSFVVMKKLLVPLLHSFDAKRVDKNERQPFNDEMERMNELTKLEEDEIYVSKRYDGSTEREVIRDGIDKALLESHFPLGSPPAIHQTFFDKVCPFLL
ncbi:unnamed protein product [Acanthoscelides obtectus]|uniref:Uncharacterized protein n=1 Tax=Acanthoscelides obtectus TaxID=200917 RepID=A0A9P0LK28_ACAOB|nr:unnamed protein product [Acanthoscelides obtectus]CAK1659665.1 hypothetical protein AOBTE_LOCUS21603 [Acanthoscelides obtectus]